MARQLRFRNRRHGGKRVVDAFGYVSREVRNRQAGIAGAGAVSTVRSNTLVRIIRLQQYGESGSVDGYPLVVLLIALISTREELTIARTRVSESSVRIGGQGINERIPAPYLVEGKWAQIRRAVRVGGNDKRMQSTDRINLLKGQVFIITYRPPARSRVER